MLRVFPIYYRGAKAPEYRSDCFEPVMAGDDPHWAELTAHERILREWLPSHPNEHYLGFCHYRRFPDFWRGRPSKYLPHVGFDRFARDFAERYAEARILPIIDGYDVIVPCPSRWSKDVTSNYQQYFLGGHPPKDIDKLIAIIRRDYPQMISDLDEYLNGRKAYLWLQFIMRADWFREFLTWEFDILRKLERECDWAGPEYQTYSTIRAPAFLAERFFNVFILHKLRTCGGKLLERQCVFLVPDAETRLVATVGRYADFAVNTLKGVFHR